MPEKTNILQDESSDQIAARDPAEIIPGQVEDGQIAVYEYTDKRSGEVYRSDNPELIRKVCDYIAMLPEVAQDALLKNYVVRVPVEEYESTKYINNHNESQPEDASQAKNESKQQNKTEPEAAVQIEQLEQAMPVEVEQAEVAVESHVEALVATDEDIARQTGVPDQEQNIRESVVAPSDEKLAEVVAQYDALYQNLQQNEDEFIDTKVPNMADIANMSQKNEETDSSKLAIVAEMLKADETAVIDLQEEDYSYQADDMGELIIEHEPHQLETAELSDTTAFEELLEDELQQIAEAPAKSPLETVIERYEVSAHKQLDERLEFLLTPPVENTSETVGEDASQPAETAKITELMQYRIEALPASLPEQKQQAKDQYEAVKELAAQIAEIEISSIDLDWRPEEDVAELRAELVVSVQQLFELIDIPADEDVIQRFVDRLIIDRLQELKAILPEVVDSPDTGTHEHKLFEDNLQWLKSTLNPDTWLIQLIGRLSVNFAL